MVILKLVVVIAVLLALVFLKIKPHTALAVCSAILLLIYGKGLAGFGAAFSKFAADSTSWSLPLTVLLIAILSGVMGKTGMLQKMVNHLKPALRSTKLTIAITPALIGLLAVAGGAFISCPLVDELGKTLDIPPTKKAAINLAFRHCIMFAYPLNGSVIIAAQLSGVPVPTICKYLLPMSLWMTGIAWFLMLRNVKDVVMPKENGQATLRHIGLFLLNISPILVTLFLTVATPLEIYMAVPVGIVIALIAANLQEDTKPKDSLFDLLFKKVNYKMLLVIIAALFFKACISSVSEIGDAMRNLTASGLPVEVIIILITLLTSFPTGSIQTAAAIIVPLLASFTADPTQLALYVGLTLCSSIFGYYFSPVHMCQLLTIEYFGTDLKSLLKEYRIFIPMLAAGMALWYLGANMILL